MELFCLMLSCSDKIESLIDRKEIKMFDYISQHNTKEALQLLETIEDLNEQFLLGNTFLNCSTFYNEYEITKELLRRGADVNIITDTFCFPLLNAIEQKCKPIVDLLLEYNANTSILYLFINKLIQYTETHGDYLLKLVLSRCTLHELKNVEKHYPGIDVTEYKKTFKDSIVSLPNNNFIWEQIQSYI